MSKFYLTLKIKFDMRDGSFEIDSDVKPEIRSDFIYEFIRSQVGVGEDTRAPAIQDVYNITLQWYAFNDSFKIKSDTGNYGLRDGILKDVASKLNKKEGKVLPMVRL